MAESLRIFAYSTSNNIIVISVLPSSSTKSLYVFNIEIYLQRGSKGSAKNLVLLEEESRRPGRLKYFQTENPY
jgi:hypothetical protein